MSLSFGHVFVSFEVELTSFFAFCLLSWEKDMFPERNGVKLCVGV